MKALWTFLVFCVVPAFSQSQLDQAKSLYDARKYDESARVLSAINEKNTNYHAAQYYLGRIAYDKKDYEAAEEYFESAIEASPNVADYHYWLGNTLGGIAGDANVFKQGILAPKIKEEYETTIKLDPKNLNAQWGLITFYTQAPGFMGGSFEKALETAGAIAKINEGDGHRAKAMVYEKQENYTEAEKEYIAAYKLSPTGRQALVNFYVKRKLNDKAFAVLEEAMLKDPADILVRYSFGRTSAITGQRLERGEECLKKYLTYQPKENEPSHGGANMRLGQIYEKKGNKAEARRCYETAIKIDQSLTEAKEGLARVSK